MDTSYYQSWNPEAWYMSLGVFIALAVVVIIIIVFELDKRLWRWLRGRGGYDAYLDRRIKSDIAAADNRKREVRPFGIGKR
jgi:hypothetical protein